MADILTILTPYPLWIRLIGWIAISGLLFALLIYVPPKSSSNGSKNLLAFLAPFPRWLRFGMLAVGSSLLFLLLIYAPSRSSDKGGGDITIAVANNSGYVAGGNISISTKAQDSASELAQIFRDRAAIIERSLADLYPGTDTTPFLERFRVLHQHHVAALEAGNIVQAHELLSQVHQLTFELDRKAFWDADARRRENGEIVLYSLSQDAFLRSPMIRQYASPADVEALVAEHRAARERDFRVPTRLE